ncbi:MAG: hypothetical protein D6805_04725, partial [Planctomycetota bacterium]
SPTAEEKKTPSPASVPTEEHKPDPIASLFDQTPQNQSSPPQPTPPPTQTNPPETNPTVEENATDNQENADPIASLFTSPTAEEKKTPPPTSTSAEEKETDPIASLFHQIEETSEAPTEKITSNSQEEENSLSNLFQNLAQEGTPNTNVPIISENEPKPAEKDFDALEAASTEKISSQTIKEFSNASTEPIEEKKEPSVHDVVEDLFGGETSQASPSPQTPISSEDLIHDIFGTDGKTSSSPTLEPTEPAQPNEVNISTETETREEDEEKELTRLFEENVQKSEDQASDTFEELFETAPSTSSEKQPSATSEISEFMEDYKATEELQAMSIQEASMKHNPPAESPPPHSSPANEDTSTQLLPNNEDIFPEFDPDFEWDTEQNQDTSTSLLPPSTPLGPSESGAIMGDFLADLDLDKAKSKQKSKKQAKLFRSLIKWGTFLLALILLIPISLGGWYYYNYQAGIDFSKKKEYKKALEKLHSVEHPYFLEIIDKKKFRKICSKCYLGIGDQYLDKNKFSKARKSYQKALSYNPHKKQKISRKLAKVDFKEYFIKAKRALAEGFYQETLQNLKTAFSKTFEEVEKQAIQQLVAQTIKKWKNSLKNITLESHISNLEKIKTYLPKLLKKRLLTPLQKEELQKSIQSSLLKLKIQQSKKRYLEILNNTSYTRIQAIEKAFPLLKTLVQLLPDKLQKDKYTKGFREFALESLQNFMKNKQYDAASKLIQLLERSELKKMLRYSQKIQQWKKYLQYQQSKQFAQDAFNKKNWKKAIQYFFQAIRHEPNNPDNSDINLKIQEAKTELLSLAEGHEGNGDWEKAIEIYKFLKKYFPRDPSLSRKIDIASAYHHYYLVQEQQKQLEWDLALKNTLKSLNHIHSLSNTMQRKIPAQIQQLEKELKEKRKFFQKQQRRFKQYKAKFSIAMENLSKRKWKEALLQFQKAKNIMGQYGEKATKLKKKIQYCQKMLEKEREANFQLYFQKARKLIVSPNPYHSLQALRTALKFLPKHKKYYTKEHLLCIKLEKFAQGLKNMVYVPQGNFFMGENKPENDIDLNQSPQHQTFVPGYFIDKYEVTNREYEEFLKYIQKNKNTPNEHKYCHPEEKIDFPEGKDHTPKFWYDKKWNKPNYPVVGVDWYDAYAFARFKGKRLPTEKEWEKAARGSKDKRLWPWGKIKPGKRKDQFDPNRLNHYTTGNKHTTPVGSYPLGVSPYGCFDMAGNVWEWTIDILKPYPNSPWAVPREQSQFYVARGGSWNDWEIYYGDKRLTEVVFRMGFPRTKRGPHIGFRCVKDAPKELDIEWGLRNKP